VISGFLEYPIRGKKFSYSVAIRERLHTEQTEYQRIDIYDTYAFGKILTLDGHVQLASLDEAAYHEALVHIPLSSVDLPTRALVVGGGDGGVLRELCKWNALQAIDMVEIDPGVIHTCRRYLPEISEGAFEDPRVTVHIQDAFPFVAEIKAKYDLIVMDITDVYEGEDGALSEALFTSDFHRNLHEALSPGGFLVTQADNHVFCAYSMQGTAETLAEHFKHVGGYQAIVPSFGGFSGYCWASNDNVVRLTWSGAGGLPLQYLNQTTYNLAFQDLGFGGAILGES
jgi:spermidine synthase